MSLPSHDSATSGEAPPSLAERRQRLAVLCALDRAHLRLVLSPPPRSTESSAVGAAAAEGLRALLGVARFLPGKLGLWSRRAGMAASFVRLLR